MAKKAELLEKAAELKLDVSEKNTIAEIETAIAAAEKHSVREATVAKAGKRSAKAIEEAEAKAEKERVIAEYKKQHPEVVPSSPEAIVDEAIKTQGHSELKDYIVGVGVQAGKTFVNQGQDKSALKKAIAQNKELPKTGDASLASTIIGLTMVTLGFGLKGKKKD